MPCSGADKYLDSISSIKGDDQPQTLTYFQKLVSSQGSSQNWRIVYQSYQCPVFETDWKKLRKTGRKIYRLFYNWLQTHEIYLKGSNRFRWHPMFQKLIISRGVLIQPNLMCCTLQLSLGPDHIRRHHRRPKLTSREKANDEFMNASRVVWLGVKLREEPLKFWTRYKGYYGERNMVDLQR